MSTMINGAAIMDLAIIVIAANEECPQPQTLEHIQATKILGIKNYIVVQNKIDLVTKKQAYINSKQIINFIKNITGIDIIPIPTNARQLIIIILIYY